MGKFAKLFEVGEEQVLIYTQANDDGNPSLVVSTEINDNEASLRISFGPKTTSKTFDIEKAWDRCDRSLAALNKDDAEAFRNILLAKYAVPAGNQNHN